MRPKNVQPPWMRYYYPCSAIDIILFTHLPYIVLLGIILSISNCAIELVFISFANFVWLVCIQKSIINSCIAFFPRLSDDLIHSIWRKKISTCLWYVILYHEHAKNRKRKHFWKKKKKIIAIIHFYSMENSVAPVYLFYSSNLIANKRCILTNTTRLVRDSQYDLCICIVNLPPWQMI